jgi:hypothetical protein
MRDTPIKAHDAHDPALLAILAALKEPRKAIGKQRRHRLVAIAKLAPRPRRPQRIRAELGPRGRRGSITDRINSVDQHTDHQVLSVAPPRQCGLASRRVIGEARDDFQLDRTALLGDGDVVLCRTVNCAAHDELVEL